MTHQPKLVELAEPELAALRCSRLMVSGRYRIPWTYAGETAQSLQRKGMIDHGGYLTAAALRAKEERNA